MIMVCRWCGKKLRPNRDSDGSVVSYGYSGDGFWRTGSPFCSLRCGHRYAARLIRQQEAS